MTVPIVLNKTVISSIASLAFYELGLKPILYVNILDHIYIYMKCLSLFFYISNGHLFKYKERNLIIPPKA